MTPSPFDPIHNDTSRHVRNGVLSTGAIQAIKMLCSFGSVVVLSRMLPPSDFGLMAMVGPVMGFIGLFQDLGLSQATVQKQGITHDEVNAFFWINVAMGLVLSLVVLAISPLVGWYYGDERVTALTAAMSVLILIGTTGNQHSALLRRRMQFGKIAFIDALGTLGTFAATLVFALTIGGYWALYFGGAAGAIIPSVCVWIASGWRPTRPQKVSGLTPMLKFGAGMTVTSILGFLSSNIDNVLIGRAYGDQSLGLYDRAYKLLLFPLQRFVYPMSGIMIPVLSRLLDDPEKYTRTYLKVLRQMTFALWPGILWAGLMADTLIPTLLGPQWSGAAPIFRFLSIAGFAHVLSSSIDWLFISQGKSGMLARFFLFNSTLSISAIALGVPFGAIGVAKCYAAAAVIRIPVVWWFLSRKHIVNVSRVFASLAPHFAGSCVAGVSLWAFVRLGGPHLPALASLSAGLGLAYGGTTAIAFCFPHGRETIREALLFVRESLSRFGDKTAR